MLRGWMRSSPSERRPSARPVARTPSESATPSEVPRPSRWQVAQATSRVPLRMGSKNSIWPSRNLGEGTRAGASRGLRPRAAMTRSSARSRSPAAACTGAARAPARQSARQSPSDAMAGRRDRMTAFPPFGPAGELSPDVRARSSPAGRPEARPAWPGSERLLCYINRLREIGFVLQFSCSRRRLAGPAPCAREAGEPIPDAPRGHAPRRGRGSALRAMAARSKRAPTRPLPPRHARNKSGHDGAGIARMCAQASRTGL